MAKIALASFVIASICLLFTIHKADGVKSTYHRGEKKVVVLNDKQVKDLEREYQAAVQAGTAPTIVTELKKLIGLYKSGKKPEVEILPTETEDRLIQRSKTYDKWGLKKKRHRLVAEEFKLAVILSRVAKSPSKYYGLSAPLLLAKRTAAKETSVMVELNEKQVNNLDREYQDAVIADTSPFIVTKLKTLLDLYKSGKKPEVEKLPSKVENDLLELIKTLDKGKLVNTKYKKHTDEYKLAVILSRVAKSRSKWYEPNVPMLLGKGPNSKTSTSSQKSAAQAKDTSVMVELNEEQVKNLEREYQAAVRAGTSPFIVTELKTLLGLYQSGKKPEVEKLSIQDEKDLQEHIKTMEKEVITNKKYKKHVDEYKLAVILSKVAKSRSWLYELYVPMLLGKGPKSQHQ